MRHAVMKSFCCGCLVVYVYILLGLLSIIMRDMSNISHEGPKWIVLDGDIDPMWIESLNTVMDDNKARAFVICGYFIQLVRFYMNGTYSEQKLTKFFTLYQCLFKLAYYIYSLCQYIADCLSHPLSGADIGQ